jgi:phosphoribosyl 1,2-cyclic phosphate phosphodiesterase
MRRALTILGCGSSGGVPRVAQGWGACDPGNPRNRRRRCSVLVEQGVGAALTRVLVDTSPDLREQLLDANIAALDAVFITHPHADHTHGIDDLRPLYLATRRRVEVYMDEPTTHVLKRAFSYAFETPAGSSYPSMLDARRLTSGEICRIEGAGGPLEALPIQLEHGEIGSLGFRFGRLAYTPDVSAIPASSTPLLEDLDVWIIDGLRYSRHPTHFSVDEALDWVARLRPRQAVITNLHTDLDYAELKSRLPGNVTPAFDGMRIEGF